MQITTIGLDIAKNVFQVHGIDATEKVVVRKQLRRSQVIAFFKALPPCLIGMEACATAHYWARELTKLGHALLRLGATLLTVTLLSRRTRLNWNAQK
jgi:transposase